jgi:hypothetical protein
VPQQIRPLTPSGVATAVAASLDARSGRVRLCVDGAPAADPNGWAYAIAEALTPRPTLHVRADHFWRPASLRLEQGRQNPEAWLESWLDDAALRREVLEPFARAGRALPSLRDPVTDRSARVPVRSMPANAVLIVSGTVLQGRDLPFDLTVHLHMSAAALERRTPPDEKWTLTVLARYADEHHPQDRADFVVRVDDPRHPALVVNG